jgi:alpha-mannosidase
MSQSRVESIYLIHHSHTDVGYTHDQPIVWDLHRRFLDAALDQCERGLDSDDDASFRWTVESTAVLEHWIRTSSDRQVARFVELAKAGRIEVTAMLANLTPLYDADQLIESFRPLRLVRDELGLPVEHAMNSDVNGENWPLVDILLDLGIRTFSMSINTHFGGPLDPHPLAFHWQGPSRRSILAWNGFSYGLAREIGIGRDARQLAEDFWPRLDAWLTSIDYPLPVLMLQIFHPFGDNGSADPRLSAFVRRWNATGGAPRLRIALPRDWWRVVATHADRLPTLRGDWTDYWNFGCASTAREVAINRVSRSRLFVADAAWAAVAALGGEEDPARRPVPGTREAAHRALNLFDEHTWGTDCSIRRPQDEDTLAQWHHKTGYAYTARSLSLLLARDAVAELARRVKREADDRLLVFNPLPWERTVAGLVQDPDPSRQRGEADDPTASRHYLDRFIPPRQPLALAPARVPAFGYAIVATSSLAAPTVAVDDAATVENHRHRLAFDRQRGGVQSWFDRDLGRELIDRDAGLAFGGFVHERVAADGYPWPRKLIFDRPSVDLPPHHGWNPDWPAERRAATAVLEHRVERSPLGIRVIQRLEAPGVHSLTQEVFLPAQADHVEFSSAYEMTEETGPEATYVAFPFDVPHARARLDLGGQAIEAEEEQLPGACRDYFTVQRWVDFSNLDFGVTVAGSTTPMVQLGDFHFGKKQSRFALDRALLLGWPTNNYWETNFAASQPGLVTARYAILPHRGSFSEAAAHRFGLEQAVPASFQHLGEEPANGPSLPRQGTLLELPDDPVLTLRAKPADVGDGLIVRLLNASDGVTTARLGSGLLHVRAAERCDLLEHRLEQIPVEAGSFVIELPARGLCSVRVLADGM